MPIPQAPFAAGPGEDEVERVIYASLASNQEHIYATMESIREHALRNNPTVGIHVALLYQSGWFLHWAEGPSEHVNALFERIGRDPRHHSQYVVHHSRGRRLLMTPWSMMLSSSPESGAQLGGRVMHLRAEMRAGRQFAPHSAIRRLTAPMQLPQALQLADPESYYRVGVISAAGNRAFDLVHWLSERAHTTTAKRRFAGETDLDSGSELVDFMRGPTPCRVVAVARADILHGLRRAFLQDWQLLILLFSGDVRKDTMLLSRVRAALHDLPVTPDLLAIVPDQTTYARMEIAARANGLTLHRCLTKEGDWAAIWRAADTHLDGLGDPPSSVWDVLEKPLGD